MGWFEQLRSVWNRLPGQQRLFMASVAICLLVVIVLSFAWAGRQEFSVLYARMEQEAAAEVVEDLRSNDVDYKLRDGGRTVMIPARLVHAVRLPLASSGLPRASGDGYELLDTNKMGWTDFVQKLQSRRALEGEIGRTIQSLDEIDQARAHLVIPEESRWQNDEKPTSAALGRRLRSGTTLRESNVQGIVHLVAAAVEGLHPDDVTVLDTNGRLLSRASDDENLLGTTSDQIYLTRTVEEGLARKAQTALEQVLGPNKAVVRVSAELDFERVETTREIYDSENPAIRSEQRSEQSAADAGTTEESTTNYEVSKTIEHAVDNPGAVKRLSASIFIDGTYEVDEEGARSYVPRAAEQMEQLNNLIKATIGFDSERGDELTVENIAFDDTELQRRVQEMEKTQRLDMIQKFGGIAVSLLLAAGALFILWRFVKRAGGIGPIGDRGPLALVEEEEEETIQAKDVRAAKLEKRLQKIAGDPPENIARIIRAWVKEA